MIKPSPFSTPSVTFCSPRSNDMIKRYEVTVSSSLSHYYSSCLNVHFYFSESVWWNAILKNLIFYSDWIKWFPEVNESDQYKQDVLSGLFYDTSQCQDLCNCTLVVPEIILIRSVFIAFIDISRSFHTCWYGHYCIMDTAIYICHRAMNPRPWQEWNT